MLEIETSDPSSARPGFVFGVLAALTIMPVGFNLALPGIEGAQPTEVFHGVFIHNIMTFGWIGAALVGAPFVHMRSTVSPGVRTFAALLVLLGVVGIISAVFNVRRYSTLADLGEIARIFLSAFYFVLMSHWVVTFGPIYLMRLFLGGIAIGGLVNLYYTLTIPYNVVGILPFLYSRNGAGGILALSITLAAWTWHIGKRKETFADGLVLAGVTAVGLTAVALSFSKTAMMTGVIGVLAWLIVLRFSPWTIVRIRSVRWLVLAALVAYVAVPAGRVTSVMTSITESVSTKFTAVFSPVENGSVRDRLGYYMAVGEIMSAHPINAIVGVGFSGFYPTVLHTKAYAYGMVEEEPGAGRLSNPHNSFLYYAAELGLTGLMVIAALFVLFIRAVLRSVEGAIAYPLALAMTLAYLFYGSALPTLFKTEVLYIPAAVAIATARRSPR